jgi:hypothetical protein
MSQAKNLPMKAPQRGELEGGEHRVPRGSARPPPKCYHRAGRGLLGVSASFIF